MCHAAIRWVFLMFSIVLAGCEESYSTVHGKVTLDGEPLSGAMVGFFPEQGRGSYGTTEADGSYTLMYTFNKAGVPAGPCVVRITTGDATHRERLPEKYHEQSELTREVMPGDNEFDFALELK